MQFKSKLSCLELKTSEFADARKSVTTTYLTPCLSSLSSDGPAVYPNVFLRGPLAPPSGADTVPVRGRHYGGRGSFNSAASGSGRPLRQHSPHVSFSGNLEYLGESSTDCDGEFPPPPPPDLLYEAPPPPPVPEKNLSSFGAPWNNSYRSVLHSHPRSHGYAGVSTSLVKNSTTPTPPLVVPDGGRQRWGSPHSFNDDDDRTTSTTSGSYVVNPDDLRKEIDDLILNDMIV